MRTVLVEGFISYNTNSWDGDEKFSFESFKMDTGGYVNVGPYTVEIQVPDNYDPRAQQVKQLEAEKQKMLEQKRLEEIERDEYRLGVRTNMF